MPAIRTLTYPIAAGLLLAGVTGVAGVAAGPARADTTAPAPLPDGVRVLADQPMAAAGGAARQELTLSNDSAAELAAATFEYTAPAGFTPGALPDHCVQDSATVSCALGSVAAHSATSVTIDLTVAADAPVGQTTGSVTLAGYAAKPVYGDVLPSCATALPDAARLADQGVDAVEQIAACDGAEDAAIAPVQNIVLTLPAAGAAKKRDGDATTINWFGDPLYHFVAPLAKPDAGPQLAKPGTAAQPAKPGTAAHHLTRFPFVGKVFGCHDGAGAPARTADCTRTYQLPGSTEKRTQPDDLTVVADIADEPVGSTDEVDDVVGVELDPAAAPGEQTGTSTVTYTGSDGAEHRVESRFTVTVLPAGAPRG